MDTVGSYLGGRMLVAVGDICTYQGDAIVNAANSSLAGGGGVDGAIHRAAGKALDEACRVLRAGPFPDGLPAGKAVATTAGALALKAVIHTVGPIWRGGNAEEARLLASAYRSSLAIAAKEAWDHIAFPAISTGVYGYPKDEAARIAFKSIRDFLAANELPKTVCLVFYVAHAAKLFLSTADALA